MAYLDLLQNMYYGNTIQQYIITFAVALGAIVLGKILSYIVRNIIKHAASKTATMFDDIVVAAIDKPLVFFVFIWGLYAGVHYLTLPENMAKVIIDIIRIMFTISVTWFLISFVDQLIVHYLIPLSKKTESDLDDHLVPFVQKFVKFFIILIAAIVIIGDLGYNVTSLITGLGIGGLAVALAAQSFLGNIIGGLTIISDKPFKLNDRIRIDKFDGTVKEIGMRSTRIETLDGSIVSIPNQLVSSNALENITQERARRIKFDLGLTYDTSAEKLEQAKDIVAEILKKRKEIEKKDDGSPNYDVKFTAFGPSSLNITVVYFISIKENVTLIQDAVNMEIKKKFDKAKIEFAFPTQTVYVKK